RPGSWSWEDGGAEYAAPRGDEVDVFLRVTRPDGSTDERSVRDWIVDVHSGDHPPAAPFRFAGSRFVQFRGQAVYDADYAGNLVGLATFGNEVVAWAEVFSPESSIDELKWIANTRVVPVFGTPVTMILRPRAAE
ncbi:MAG: YdjY domain-containing protein, partial [Phycisphaerales bacterium]